MLRVIPSGDALLKEKFLAIGFSQLDIVERIRQKDVRARISRWAEGREAGEGSGKRTGRTGRPQ